MAASDSTPAFTKGAVPCPIAGQLARELAFHKVILLPIACSDGKDGSVDAGASAYASATEPLPERSPSL